ncbi:neurturin [Hoplias malabaricus]|uniref:neurturin n=1 Tax=Hoplias malabaricus TaxID=27720 RepID=UPI003462146C
MALSQSHRVFELQSVWDNLTTAGFTAELANEQARFYTNKKHLLQGQGRAGAARAQKTPDANGHGKGWRNQEHHASAASIHSHLRYWKVMLLMCVCLLGLADGWILPEDTESNLTTARSTANIAQKQQHQPLWPSKSAWTDLYEPSVMEEGDNNKSRWQRSPAGFTTSEKKRSKERKNRKRLRDSGDCHLEKKQLRVRDLGLGYDSDEIVLFKYCVGTCEKSRKNYDVALKHLMDHGSITEPKVSIQPCCRPTRFETVSFMDARTIWQTIRWLSAANCSCVG